MTQRRILLSTFVLSNFFGLVFWWFHLDLDHDLLGVDFDVNGLHKKKIRKLKDTDEKCGED